MPLENLIDEGWRHGNQENDLPHLRHLLGQVVIQDSLFFSPTVGT